MLPSSPPAVTSQTLWIPRMSLFLAIRDAMINANIIMIPLFVRRDIIIQAEKAMALWPLGIPPLRGVPL